MTQQELADDFGTTQQAVAECLKRLKDKWPHLFLFTKPQDPFQYDPEKHDRHALRTF